MEGALVRMGLCCNYFMKKIVDSSNDTCCVVLVCAPVSKTCFAVAGYTLNRVALDLLMNELWYETMCHPHWQGPQEDITIARCFFRRRLQCMDTNDELEETRYHAWDAAYHAAWNHNKKANWFPKILEEFQHIASKDGMGQISRTSVSFHLKQDKRNPALPSDSGVRFYYANLYGKCNL